MEKLDSKQFEAATHKAQHVLCNSKAGSGKTKTLMNRCLYLMENGVKPSEIMLVTFTNKAAHEMTTRINKLSPEGSKVLCGTFHNIALMFLRRYADKIDFESTFTILSPDDSEKIFKESINYLIKLHGINEEWQKSLKPNRILHEYSASRNLNIPITEFLENRQYILGLIPIIKESINLYEERKKNNELMDFDDLLFYFNLLLQIDEVKTEILSRYKHILVDEFQDVNSIQFAIVNNLVGDNGNLFAVGDPYQCIYGFRGSQIEFIDSFEDYYGASVVELNHNYRSTQEILDFGAEVTNDKAKMIAYLGKGQKPNLYIAEGSFGNVANNKIATKIAEKIDYLIKNEKVNPTEIAILARSTNQLQLVEAELKKRGIAYVMRAGFSYFEKSHIKDILSFLSITVNKKNKEGLNRSLSLFKGFGPKSIKDFMTVYSDNECDINKVADMIKDGSYKLTKSSHEGFSIFFNLYNKIQAESLINKKVETFFKEFYYEYIKNEYPDDMDVRLSEAAYLIEMAQKYDKLEEFINEVMVDTSINNKESGDTKIDKIVISTIHRAKGLEWDHVFMCNMEQLYKSSPREEPEETFEVSEDARLLYVAITRAKKTLNVYVASEDMHGYNKSSVNLTHLLRRVSRINKYRF